MGKIIRKLSPYNFGRPGKMWEELAGWMLKKSYGLDNVAYQIHIRPFQANGKLSPNKVIVDFYVRGTDSPYYDAKTTPEAIKYRQKILFDLLEKNGGEIRQSESLPDWLKAGEKVPPGKVTFLIKSEKFQKVGAAVQDQYRGVVNPGIPRENPVQVLTNPQKKRGKPKKAAKTDPQKYTQSFESVQFPNAPEKVKPPNKIQGDAVTRGLPSAVTKPNIIPKIQIDSSPPKKEILPSLSKEQLISFKEIKFNPKLRAAGGFLLSFGINIITSLIENWHYKKILEAMDKTISEEINHLWMKPETIQEIKLFRKGEKYELGYQLFFKVYFTVVRTKDTGDVMGGYPIRYTVESAKFNRVEINRSGGNNKIPEFEKGYDIYSPTDHHYYFGNEPKYESEFNKGNTESGGCYYIEIFESSVGKIQKASEDAADGQFGYFQNQFITRNTGPGFGDNQRDYYNEFEKYYKLFPDSPAGKLYLVVDKNSYLHDITLIELGRKKPSILMYPPYNFSFDKVLNQVRWGLTDRILFIKDVYEYVIILPERDQIEYLELYDKYFRELDDGYTKCNVSANRLIGDKRIIHRMTSDDVTQTHSPRFEIPIDAEFSREEAIKYLQTQ